MTFDFTFIASPKNFLRNEPTIHVRMKFVMHKSGFPHGANVSDIPMKGL
jgi:hypothetical protein